VKDWELHLALQDPNDPIHYEIDRKIMPRDNITEEDIEAVVDKITDDIEGSVIDSEAHKLGISLSALMDRVTKELVARGA
jgi:hypothetical protein